MAQTREQVITTTTSDSIAVVPPVVSVTPTVVTTEHLEQFPSDAGASRQNTLNRVRQIIWMILVLIEILLAIRFILRLLGANPEAGFAQFIYGITAAFVAPFAGLFGTPRFDASVFEFTTLVAMIIYALLAWVIVRVMLPFLNETRTSRLSRWQDPPLE